jgi:hypothetical protein
MSFLDNLIYINENSICKSLCNEIISMFEEETNKYEGVTAIGLNKNIKDTLDFIIPRDNNIKWNKIDKFLSKELDRNIKKYISNLSKKLDTTQENSILKYNVCDTDFLITGEFMIQKYIENKGRYIYHNDATIDYTNKKSRVLTYIFYLNDVDEGGHTEFYGELKIKPKAGQLVLFPATWTYPHRGMMPKSSDKYIITGWLWQTK